MASINRQVWRILDCDLSIQLNLNRGIINIRGLAKFMLKRYDLQASVDAVISAIRRYEVETNFEKLETNLESVFRGATMSTRNNLVAITAQGKAKKDIPGLYKKRGVYIGDAPRIVTGRAEIKIIAPRDQRDEIVDAIGKANIINVEENLSELGLVLDKKAIKTKGVVARITNEIAMNNINLAELIICAPELFLYLKEQDMVRCHGLIMQLIQ